MRGITRFVNRYQPGGTYAKAHPGFPASHTRGLERAQHPDREHLAGPRSLAARSQRGGDDRPGWSDRNPPGRRRQHRASLPAADRRVWAGRHQRRVLPEALRGQQDGLVKARRADRPHLPALPTGCLPSAARAPDPVSHHAAADASGPQLPPADRGTFIWASPRVATPAPTTPPGRPTWSPRPSKPPGAWQPSNGCGRTRVFGSTSTVLATRLTSAAARPEHAVWFAHLGAVNAQTMTLKPWGVAYHNEILAVHGNGS